MCSHRQLSPDLTGNTTLVKYQDEFQNSLVDYLIHGRMYGVLPFFFLKDTVTLSNFLSQMPTSLLRFHMSMNHGLLFSGKCQPDYLTGRRKFYLLG